MPPATPPRASSIPLARLPRILILLAAHDASATLGRVLHRLPTSLRRNHVEVLVIGGSPSDDTFRVRLDDATSHGEESGVKLTVLRNREIQRPGGNQKLGYRYAIEHGFDFVALVQDDGRCAPECLPELLAPLLAGEADAVFGSRMMNQGGARRRGMPLSRYACHKMLARLQNALLGSSLTEFRSGYRLYSVEALRKVPFERNTNASHFDTEITIQFVRAGLRIKELPIPTGDGEEASRARGLRGAWNACRTLLRARIHGLNLLYDRKFDVSANEETYDLKLGYRSSHTLAIDAAQPGNTVLDVGCGQGYVARELVRKGCHVTGLDQYAPVEPPDGATGIEFIRWNLDAKEFPVDISRFDQILMLDIIEHLRDPENFMEELCYAARCRRPEIVLTTANIGFLMTRLMLLCGAFNYGKVGILDRTHTRLFTFRSLRTLLEQTGYEVLAMEGVPAPFPKALGDHWLSRSLLALNEALIRLSRGLFSYQICMRARALPSVNHLLQEAMTSSESLRAELRRDREREAVVG